MPSGDGAPVRSARPSIQIDGRDNTDLADGLLGMTIVENTAGLYRCEAMFGNWGRVDNHLDYVYFDRQTLDFGRAFKVTYASETLFEGRVMGLEALFPQQGMRSITVLAEDRLQDLRMTRRTRTFADVTDTDVIQQIAGDHGLSPSIDLPSVQHKTLAQVNQSDLAFVRERARSLDGEVWMQDRTLNAKSHTSRAQETLDLTYGAELYEFSVLADLAAQRTSVVVSGWDVSGKQGITYEATDSVIRGELNGDESGVSILQQALGARKEQLSHTVPVSAQEAQFEAEAFFRMSARRFVVGHGLADVQPALRVGKSVRLSRLGSMFDGKYYVTEVRHQFDVTGIHTEFTAERAGVGRR